MKRRPIQKSDIIARTISDPKTQCWNWTGAKTYGGYGMATKGLDHSRLVHRRSYELWKGQIPEGMMVLHKCDNPSCCNPDHLFIGTGSDNINDAITKGRWPRCKRLFTDGEISKIRSDSRSDIDQAKYYGVHRTTIYHIRKGNRYASA